MAGYLDTYGVVDTQRERRNRWVLLLTVLAVITALALFLIFRNFQEKRVVSHFLEALKASNYQEAYRVWGCTPQTPCRDYAFEKFMEDWGAAGQYANAGAAQVTNVDSCGGGTVLTVAMPNREPFGLWVERSTKALGFAPWPRCPGRHWNLSGFLKSFFSSPPPPEAPKK